MRMDPGVALLTEMLSQRESAHHQLASHRFEASLFDNPPAGYDRPVSCNMPAR